MIKSNRKAAQWLDRFESTLQQTLHLGPSTPELLTQAMTYSALAGGKRIRPLLVYGSGRALGLESEQVDAIACAIEIIHAYSLIHDDLPAMDDDDLRRGRPTCHKAFDEATAILAGDALQALAFEILARDPQLSRYPERQVKIIGRVAEACGSAGMAGGQVLDLSAVGKALTLEQLETMHRLKTGALIRISATAPAYLAAAEPSFHAKLKTYGECVGLAFQIQDDILDVTGNKETVGKSTQSDAARDKPTFPALIGLGNSQRRARELRDQAIAELEGIPGDCSTLAWLAEYAIERNS